MQILKMKLLFIFIASFVFLCAYANQNETSTEVGTTSAENSTQLGVSTTEAPVCGPNEEYKRCRCGSDLCWKRFINLPCVLCFPGCACLEGYKRQRLRGPCRPIDEC